MKWTKSGSLESIVTLSSKQTLLGPFWSQGWLRQWWSGTSFWNYIWIKNIYLYNPLTTLFGALESNGQTFLHLLLLFLTRLISCALPGKKYGWPAISSTAGGQLFVLSDLFWLCDRSDLSPVLIWTRAYFYFFCYLLKWHTTYTNN